MKFKHHIVNFVLSLLFLVSPAVQSEQPDNYVALLVIGSSYINGTTRIDDNTISALNGAAVGAGSYLSLGDALIRSRKLNGLVINEGVVGATTQDRVSCLWYDCLPGGQMPSYMSQFENALRRIAIYDPVNFTISGYNAKYVVIDMPNDCIHSDAFGVPQASAKPCINQDFIESANRVVDVANKALQLGITPILTLPPKYEDLELSLVQQGLGMYWVIGEYEYNILSETYKTTFESKVPGAIILDVWKHFTHRGDGIHPNRKTVKQAAEKIANIVSKTIGSTD